MADDVIPLSSVLLRNNVAAKEDPARAIQRPQRAALDKPKNTSILLDLGNALADAGETIRAIGTCGTILKLNPTSGYAWNNLGNIFSALGDVEGALACLENAVRLLPNEAISQYSLRRALSLLGREKEALEHLSQACSLNPKHTEAWTTFGIVHQHLGHWDTALECFDIALRLSPDAAEPHVNRAMVLLNQGNFRAGWPEYEYRWETPAFRGYKERPFGNRR